MSIALAVLGVVVSIWVRFSFGDLLPKFLPLMSLLSGSLFATTIVASVNGSPTLEAIVPLLGLVLFSYQAVVFIYGLILRRQSERRG